MKDIKIGIIGLGWIADSFVLPLYLDMDGVSITAVCDIDGERARRTTERCANGTFCYTDYRSMLAAGGLDGVIVAVAPHVTAEISAAFLENGIHTYIEKPPGITVAETESLLAAEQKGGGRAMVAFNRRYMPVVDRIRTLVAEKGPVYHASFEFFKASDTDPSASLATHDPLTGTGIHGVDLLRYLLGDPVNVRSSFRNVGSSLVPNSFNAVLDFKHEATGTLSVYWNAGFRSERYTLHGDAYSIVFAEPDRFSLYEHGELFLQKCEIPAGGDAGYINGFPQELIAFIDLIRSGTESRASLPDAVKTMQLIEKINKN